MRDNIVSISVRDLVEFVLRTGDLVSGFSGSSRTTEAIKAHQLIQKSYKDGYEAEVTVSYDYNYEDLCLRVNGRIDGVITNDTGFVIDEIKTTTAPLEIIDDDYNILHWAQAEVYAFIYSEQHGLNEIGVQLTYFNLDTREIKKLNKHFQFEELRNFFIGITASYLEWARTMHRWYEVRDISINNLGFPFSNYRKGQRELAVSVYKVIKLNKKLFVRAPTGIGKTAAVLFPAIKAINEGITSKLFYLTAKSITSTVAENALENMRSKGLRFKALTLTAKDRICFNTEASCNPDECEYAKGHFDRVYDAVKDIFNEDAFSRETIEAYAKKHKVCPFEFSLDLSLWADCIICDYNYVFDPRVYLKRFFSEGTNDFTFLIDEAHNLVERAREMFSAEIMKKPVLELRKSVKGKAPEVYKALGKINSYLIELRKKCEEGEDNYYSQKEAPEEIYNLLRKFMKASEEFLLENKKAVFEDKLMEMYFAAHAFIRTAERYDEKYITYVEKGKDDLMLKLFCLDPSTLMAEALKRGIASIFFSATLNPITYFNKVLGGDQETLNINFASPFPRENLCLIVNDSISTRYKFRESTYTQISGAIEAVIGGKKGNYLIYFPSYKYMNAVYEVFSEENQGVDTVCQSSEMTEGDREEFLSKFNANNTKTLVGFAVMGGVFGEGIDLTGDKLSGAVIVGVGLPQICFERDIIKNHFDEANGQGFEYSYTYPGMNKVMQAVGRVIRTENDRGVVLLIDDRFTSRLYKSLFPQEWNNYYCIRKIQEIDKIVHNFWINESKE